MEGQYRYTSVNFAGKTEQHILNPKLYAGQCSHILAKKVNKQGKVWSSELYENVSDVILKNIGHHLQKTQTQKAADPNFNVTRTSNLKKYTASKK